MVSEIVVTSTPREVLQTKREVQAHAMPTVHDLPPTPRWGDQITLEAAATEVVGFGVTKQDVWLLRGPPPSNPMALTVEDYSRTRVKARLPASPPASGVTTWSIRATESSCTPVPVTILPRDVITCPVYTVSPPLPRWGTSITLSATVGTFGSQRGPVQLRSLSGQSRELTVRSWTPDRVVVDLPPAPPFGGPTYLTSVRVGSLDCLSAVAFEVVLKRLVFGGLFCHETDDWASDDVYMRLEGIRRLDGANLVDIGNRRIPSGDSTWSMDEGDDVDVGAALGSAGLNFPIIIGPSTSIWVIDRDGIWPDEDTLLGTYHVSINHELSPGTVNTHWDHAYFNGGDGRYTLDYRVEKVV